MDMRRLVPTFGDVLFCAVMGQILVSPRTFHDGDSFRHTATGLLILSTGHVPTVDPFSFTHPGAEWVVQEWLSGVLFALAYRGLGWNGVALISGVAVASSLYIGYRLALSRGVSVFPAFVVMFGATAATMLHWLARPHVFTMVIAMTWLWLLLRARDGQGSWAWFAPIMVVWVNLHAGFMMGFALLGLSFGVDLVHAALGDASIRRRLVPTALAIGATLGAACLNPCGPALLAYPLHVVDGRWAWLLSHVGEWLPPNLREERWFEVGLVCSAAILIQSRRGLSLFEGVVLVFNAHAAFFMVRAVPLSALLSSWIIAERAGDAAFASTMSLETVPALARVRERAGALSAEFVDYEIKGGLFAALSVLACLLVSAMGGRVGPWQLLDATPDSARYPVAALAWAEERGVEGNPFTTDLWGGYLIFAGWPRYRVFVDGRSDMYGVAFMSEYVDVVNGGSSSEAVLDRYGVDWVLFDHDGPLVRTLLASGHWHRAYADTVADVLLRGAPDAEGAL